MPDRNIQLHFKVNRKELAAIKLKLKQTGSKNLSGYLRKMAIKGYVINMDLSDLREILRLLRINSNNLNQYAKRANETGEIYKADMQKLAEQQDELLEKMDLLMDKFINL